MKQSEYTQEIVPKKLVFIRLALDYLDNLAVKAHAKGFSGQMYPCCDNHRILNSAYQELPDVERVFAENRSLLITENIYNGLYRLTSLIIHDNTYKEHRSDGFCCEGHAVYIQAINELKDVKLAWLGKLNGRTS